MLPVKFGKGQMALTLALMVSFASASTYLLQNRSAPDVQLKELVDSAALAGVNSLAATATMPEAARVEASLSAVRNVMAARPGIIRSISPSVDQLTMSVVLGDSANGSHVSSTAHYIPPSEGFSSGQAADVSKAPFMIASRARL